MSASKRRVTGMTFPWAASLRNSGRVGKYMTLKRSKHQAPRSREVPRSKFRSRAGPACRIWDASDAWRLVAIFICRRVATARGLPTQPIGHPWHRLSFRVKVLAALIALRGLSHDEDAKWPARYRTRLLQHRP